MSRFIACADIHAGRSKPAFRTDNFVETGYRKLEWIVDTANEKDASVLIAGDTFHHARVGHGVVNRIIDIFQELNNPVYCVIGQHDMRYHAEDITQCPMYTLWSTGIVKILANEQMRGIYGCSWDGNHDIQLKRKQQILLIHHTITPEEPPFFLEDAWSADYTLDKFKDFKYIIAGDYHKPHVTERDGRWLINCGSVMRSDRDQMEHTPRVYFIDTQKDIVEALFIPIEKPEKVFDIERIDHINKKGIALDTTKLKELINAEDNEKVDLDDIVWSVFHHFKNNHDDVILTDRTVSSILGEAK